MDSQASLADIFIILILSSFVIERGLSFIYETDFFLDNYSNSSGAKAEFAFLVSLAYTFIADLNVVSMTYSTFYESTNSVDPIYRFDHWLADSLMLTLSYVMTAGALTGGCKPFLTLFRDVWGIQTQKARALAQHKTDFSIVAKHKAKSSAKGDGASKEEVFALLDTQFK